MKEVTKYIALDGTKFNTAEDCKEYESIINRVIEINNLRDNGEVSYCKVAIRQDKEAVKKFKYDFYMLCAEIIPECKSLFTEVAVGNRHQSRASHVLSCSSREYPILNEISYRLDCIGESGIEYDQPYFALHEDEFRGEIK